MIFIMLVHTQIKIQTKSWYKSQNFDLFSPDRRALNVILS